MQVICTYHDYSVFKSTTPPNHALYKLHETIVASTMYVFHIAIKQTNSYLFQDAYIFPLEGHPSHHPIYIPSVSGYFPNTMKPLILSILVLGIALAKPTPGTCPTCDYRPGFNQCHITTSCIYVWGREDGNKSALYYCACRAGYRTFTCPSQTA